MMVENFCGKTAAIWQLIGYALFALKVAVPIIIIVMASIEFGKAAISSDDKAIGKAAKNLVQKLVIGIVIFFIPTIVNIIIGIVGEMNDSSDEIAGCKTCLLDPLSGECSSSKSK